MNEQLYRELEPEEVNTLVQTRKTNVQAARDRLRDHLGKNEKLSREMKASQISESAGLMRKVSVGQYLRTIHDANDGFGGKTGSCREYTLLRDHQDSEPIGWIRGHTRIGPVRQVRVICCLEQYGIEMQVTSTSRNGSHSWIIISRRPNRYVDESWHDQGDLLKTLRW